MIETLMIFILSFFIYSFCGWIWESILIHAIYMKKFVNRGFLNGPILPIYGSGALLVVVLFDINSINYPSFTLFLLGGFAACVLEYLTSWVMEKLFNERWWDYSKKPFNLNGRICLEGFVCFGFFSVFTIKYIQPFFNQQLSKLSFNTLMIISIVLVTFTIIDVIKSVHIAFDLRDELKEIAMILEEEQIKLHQRLQDKQKEFETLQSIETVRERIAVIEDKLKDNKKYRYGHRRILKAFPYMVKKRMRETYEKINRD